MSDPAPLSPAMTTDRGRLLTLDALRGVAVMAILIANMPGFALPDPAYSNPAAWGDAGPGDIAVWLLTEIFVNGRMRGLFSLLFGASTLLILQRADQAGLNGASLHLRRMGVLFVLGMIHRTFIWTGDILVHYALVGVVALAFVGLSVRRLCIAALLMAGLSMLLGWLDCASLLAASARDTPQAVALWNAYQVAFGTPGAAALAPEIAAMRGPWSAATAFRLDNNGDPLFDLMTIGPDTLSAMLIGMAALKSGFLTGAWPRARYRRWTIVAMALSLPAYAAMAITTMASGFDVRAVSLAELFLNVPFRLIGTVGYAALILLLLRPGGWWTTRIAAAGRMAFTNYIATSLVMTFIFYGHGLGQFARWDRAAIYLLVPPMWGLMLLWSKPCLDRFGQGPLEKLWRLATRGHPKNS
ncbi:MULTISPECIES: DUF418 domain-containing protein [unclassified Sphingomonas]|uniref:DUF418 domain-containing protein n=1 Tax=unclassified Sphingomonas TaxID=196159 RepID=UPI0028664DCF|nr:MULTISPECIES: DUF418 domain-containing protein [unclassified Sphingomonas]MDR6115765.1 uncharacterized protein [Sphingomonas sp. SORGH_AS_0789]MDR6150564.1 uncharacterized protein [Sphingomonas sp. SORGH_AS_0742]